MDQIHYEEMRANLKQLMQENALQDKRVYLFGHCNATEELTNLLIDSGIIPAAILDNSAAKQGKQYRGIEIQPPQAIMSQQAGTTVVCIAARAYAAMADQLRRLGYRGPVRKLVDYNSFAEYSLSPDVVTRKLRRVERGIVQLKRLREKHPGRFQILCPFSALGDVYFTMAYLPHFLRKREISQCVVCVVGRACGQVVRLFGGCALEVLSQQEMDEAVQAALYTEDGNTFISHQDRPYAVNISKALHVKQIPLETLYCCGVFGLPASATPCKPAALEAYGGPEKIEPGRTAILSPYAKSVTALDPALWTRIVAECRQRGYVCYTNVAGAEAPLPGTLPITPQIVEIQSLAERAGLFIGIRSGLCDVLREADCRKIALYPDYPYCDTRWKAIDMYWLPGWENIVVNEELPWSEN